MSHIEQNLLTKPGYSPYCGADACMVWARTRWNGSQFQCQCGWTTWLCADFIAAYKAKWKPEVKP
ncbi:hypothetical protein PseAD21_16990 [Pseudomonas sp. AD21]|jgi:hypothetical protein|nr:hypothetical protein PseAD21_16990 [Pseudomonas sp. AD21]